MRLISLMIALALVAPQEGSRTGTCNSRPLLGAAQALSRFELPPAPFAWTLTPDPTVERAFTLTYPSAVVTDSVENNTVTCKVWMPKDDAPSPRPGVVLLHY